ncbi:hypothetical protein GQ42DRAFT_164662 [Ramicandelaber brevisporus]|nr:hypothetical protein GQ42DRAFT_164662 [Ramicandelaber brevisporus]
MSRALNFVTQGHKIVAIGRNYAAHALELGNKVPTKPFWFFKPSSSYVSSPGKIEVPYSDAVVHHEVELGVVIGKRGRDISAKDAKDYIAGYVLALDMTARNEQDAAKAKGLPWSAAKGYDTFTPVNPKMIGKDVIDAESLQKEGAGDVHLWLKVNGEIKQSGSSKDMMFGVPQLIEHVSQVVTLDEGDLILTGTPKGVGPVQVGDVVTAGLVKNGQELSSLHFEVVERVRPSKQ